MRDKLWLELTQAKHNVDYSSLYLDKQKSISNGFTILLVVFSTGGVMGWSLWEKFPIVACAIISALSIIKLVQPEIIMNAEQQAKLSRIHIFYCGYFNKLEKLWHDFEDEEISEKTLKDTLYEILDTEIEASRELNEIHLKKPQRWVKKAAKHTNDYIQRVFNTN